MPPGSVFDYDPFNSRKRTHFQDKSKNSWVSSRKLTTSCSYPSCSLLSEGHCTNCSRAFYCSLEHQSQDWPSHKLQCNIYIDRKDVNIRAVSRIQPGQKLDTETPAVTFPNPDFKSAGQGNLLNSQPARPPTVPEVCFSCYQIRDSGLAWTCGRCSVPLCCEACEKKKDHVDNECELLYRIRKRAHELPPHKSVRDLYLDIAVTRILRLKETDEPLFGDVMDLVADPRIETYKKGRDFSFISKSPYLELLPIASMFNQDETVLMNATLVALVMGFANLHKHPTFKCIYPVLSKISHSCVPNCEYVESTSADGTLSLISTLPIPEDIPLSVDLVPDPFTGKLERAALLRQKCVFFCSCPRCSDPTDCGTFTNALKCNFCTPGYLLPIYRHGLYTWKCTHCSGTAQLFEVREILMRAENELRSIVTISSHDEFRLRWRFTFHPNHYMFLLSEIEVRKIVESMIYNGVSALRDLSGPFGATKGRCYERMRDHCKMLLRFLNQSRPGYSQARSQVLRQLFFTDFLLTVRSSHYNTIECRDHILKLIAILRESCKITNGQYCLDPPKSSLHEELLSFMKLLENVLICLTPKSCTSKAVKRLVRPAITKLMNCPLKNEFLAEIIS